MQVKEVLQFCHLTKKALAYYERKGLIAPTILENGYRDYSAEQVARLKEIAVLRQCGIGVPALQEILQSRNRSAALQKHRYLADLHAEKQRALADCLDRLAADYDIDRAFLALQELEESLFTIRERMTLAFPGNYGLFLALHFGRFLDEPIDSDEKRTAYHAIIAYLDGVSGFLDDELQEFFDACFAIEGTPTAQLEQQSHTQMTAMLADPKDYLAAHREQITDYLAYKRSDAYRASPAYRLQQKLQAFQAASGYREVFLDGLAVLSRSYRTYRARLAQADAQMLQAFPELREDSAP